MARPVLGRPGGLEVEVEVEDAVVGDLEDVGAAVVVHVHDPAEEGNRGRSPLPGRPPRRGSGAASRRRSLPPERTGEEVGVAVAVDVAEGRPLGVDALVQSQRVGRGRPRRGPR